MTLVNVVGLGPVFQ